MDRAAVYLGQVPRSLDILSQGQNSMVGLAKLSEAVLGTSTVVTGFPITATAPASLNINVGAGQVYEVEPLEATQLSGLAPDAHQIVKQGLTLDPTTLTLVPPTTVGFAVNILIEVQYADSDTGSILLTFQNPASPGTTYQGPGGNGQSSNTVRKGIAQIVPKYGTAATAGQQTTPAPDAGYVGVAVVTLSYGQTQVTSANVAPYNGNANYIPTTLTGVPSGVQTGAWVVGQATPAGAVVTNSPTAAQIAAANTYATTLFSTAAYPFALAPGMEILVYFGQGNTSTSPVLNANGGGNLPMLRQGGGAPSVGNSANGIPPDIQGWMSFVLRSDKGAWLINGLATSDVQSQVTANNPKTAGRILSVQRFTSSGTYTPSPGMTYVVVEGVGGGGGGAGGTVPSSGNVSLGAPGASGTWGKSFFTAAQVGASQPVTIGAGGTGVFQGNGTAGGTTSFGSLMSMPGGGPGLMSNNVATPTLNGSTTLGNAPTGANLAFTLGIVQGPSYAFNSAVGFGGGGGSSPYGTGLGTQINTTGANGVGQGAGGSGTVYGPTVSGAGGYGTPGLLIITEYGYTS